MADSNTPAVAVIIPAYNEEARIANVLRAAVASKLATEIIVVCDGCVDDTAGVARKFKGVTVLELKENRGKGGAMAYAVRETNAPIVAFIDADLLNLHGEHIDVIIKPLLENACEMCVGVFRGGKMWSDTAQRVTPFLSGQRAMKRWLFESVPYMDDLRMGVEYALTQAAKRRKARVMRVILRGVSNYHKEQKLGIVKGTQARFKMYSEITKTMVKTRKKRKTPRVRWH